MPNIVAIFGCLFLLPVIVYFIGFVTTLSDSIYQYYLYGLSTSPNQLALTISTEIVSQLKATMVLIPGIVLCSIASSNFKMHRHNWFRKWLRSFGIMLLCMFPVLSISGFYLIKLSGKRTRRPVKSNT